MCTRESWLLLTVVLLPSVVLAQDLAPRIEHEALLRTPAGEPLVLQARIVSATAKAIARPTALVRLSGLMGFDRLPMTPDPAGKDLYFAQISGAQIHGDLDYYFEAFDEDGNGPGRAGSALAPFHVTAVAAPSAPQVAPAPAPVTPATPAAPAVAFATGRLLVETEPAGAAVTVDGVRVGESPLEHVVLAGVPHHVVIEAKGYEPVVTDVVVLPNMDAKADLKLVKAEVVSRFLLRLTGSYAFQGPYVSLSDRQKFFTVDDKFSVQAAFGLNLSFTFVLAKHNGLLVDLGYAKVKIATDREGPNGDKVAEGSHFSAGLGYRVLIGPFSVVRPHLGVVLGVRALSLEDGDPSLGWNGERKMVLLPMVDPELGLSFQLPAHILLDLSFRMSCLDFGGPLLQLSGGLGIGAHF